MQDSEFEDKDQPSESVRPHIHTDFYTKTAKDVSGSAMTKAPMRIVMVLVAGLGVYCLYLGIMWFINLDKASAMQNVSVSVMKPKEKDGVAVADVEIVNLNPFPVNNVVISYDISGSDNSVLGSGRVTLEQMVPAGDSRVFSGIKLGAVSGNPRRMHSELADLEFTQTAKISPELSAQFAQAAAAKDRESMEGFEAIVQAAPDFEPGYVGLGQAQAANEQYEKAVATFKKALTMDPNDSNAYYGMAMAMYYDQDKDGARKAIAEALKIAPADPQIQAASKQINAE